MSHPQVVVVITPVRSLALLVIEAVVVTAAAQSHPT